jgi:hypothetical protein
LSTLVFYLRSAYVLKPIHSSLPKVKHESFLFFNVLH